MKTAAIGSRDGDTGERDRGVAGIADGDWSRRAGGSGRLISKVDAGRGNSDRGAVGSGSAEADHLRAVRRIVRDAQCCRARAGGGGVKRDVDGAGVARRDAGAAIVRLLEVAGIVSAAKDVADGQCRALAVGQSYRLCGARRADRFRTEIQRGRSDRNATASGGGEVRYSRLPDRLTGTNLVRREVFVDVPERAAVDWIHRHAGVVAPPVSIFLVGGARVEQDFGR